MGSTTISSDCIGLNAHQNGIPNGTSKILHTDTNTSIMNNEKCRLETFKGKWPIQSPVPAERLAKAGFYYTGHDMEVTCFSCGGCIGEWDYGDIAFEKHKRFFGNVCNFVNNTSNNIPYTSQSISKPRSRGGEFSTVSEKIASKPYITRGPSFESANVHTVASELGNNSHENSQSHERNFQDFEKRMVNGYVGEYHPTLNGIPSARTGNINSNRMTFSGNSASGAHVTYQEGEATQQPQPNSAKGIFMSGNSGIGARVMYNNQEVSRPTGQQSIPRNSKGIFMSGNSGLGATVMYEEFNVNNQPTVENSLNSEINSSSSSPTENVNFGIPVQAVPSSREPFFNHGTSSTSNYFPGTSAQPVGLPGVGNSLNSQRNSSSSSPTENVNNYGMPVQAVPSSREQFFNHGTANIFPVRRTIL